MNHKLKATALEMGGIIKKHSCKDKKEGDTEYQEEGIELCLFFDLHMQISNIHTEKLAHSDTIFFPLTGSGD